MKTTFITRVCLLASALTAIGLISCSEQSTLQQSIDSGPNTWESQIQYALSHGTRNNSDKVTLIGYEYRGKVNTENEKRQLIEEMFSDDAYTLVYNGICFTGPEMDTWRNLRNEIEGYGQKLQESMASEIVVGETDVIDLEWTFNNTTYHSVAIASNNRGGIIYDNIGTYAIEYKSESITDNGISETRTQSNGNYHAKFQRTESGTDEFGMIQWKISLECYSDFNETGILISKALNAYYRAQKGWTCDAKIQSLRGDENVSKFHEFIWGYAYGDERYTAYVQPGGDQFYVSFMSLGGETGRCTHRAPAPERQ